MNEENKEDLKEFGQVILEKAAFIGANATVIQCRRIKEGQIVPAGAIIR